MPRQRIVDLRAAIEEASEISPGHRAELLGLVESLSRELENHDGEEGEATDRLREAIGAAESAVRRPKEAVADEHESTGHLSELEEKAELVALEHPVIANVLTAIARLI